METLSIFFHVFWSFFTADGWVPWMYGLVVPFFLAFGVIVARRFWAGLLVGVIIILAVVTAFSFLVAALRLMKFGGYSS